MIINDSLIDIVNCKENVYQMNEIMKENVMKEPINLDKKEKGKQKQVEINRESWFIDDNDTDNENQKEFPKFVNSWDKINKASSLIMKISVDNNFMKWLLNKK